ncbi:OmpA family protein [hydrothermal vent metagenome]|uniref:OmpA family protein n=1 Tax=hydrothermal vent metagenome TaxID=652676 RepID=A0A3B0V932_9ZZZZ
MKKIILAVSVALTAGSAIAGDVDFDKRWYVTPNVSFVKPDSEKNASSGLELGLAIGKFITDRISLDFEVSQGTHDLNNGGEVEQRSFGLFSRYHFGENMGFTPFVGLGLGYMHVDQSNFNSERQALGSIVGGFSKSLSENLKLRTELRYRLENSDDTHSGEDTFADVLFNAGLSFAMGEAPRQETQTTLVEKAPQLDSDNDGVSDANDRCPNSPAGARVDSTGCTIVDGDDDRDGVPNSQDACPNSPAGAVVGRDGCEVKVVIELQGVHFDTDKSTLKPESIAILNAAVKTLGEHGSIRVEVAGHTDSRASDAYNQSLSQRRAKVVYDYLSGHGIANDRMTWKGYGESQPIATNDTAEGRAQNRRTELIVQ